MAPSSMAAKPMPPAAPDPWARAAVSAVVSGAGEGGDQVGQSGVELGDLCCGGAFLWAEYRCGAGEPEQWAGDVAGDDQLDSARSTAPRCRCSGCGRGSLRWGPAVGRRGRGSGSRVRPASRFRRRCWRCRPGRAPAVCGPVSALLGWPRRIRSSTLSSGRAPRPGRVASPQVLATSTTAVSPSRATTPFWRRPVAPCTVTVGMESAGQGGGDASVAAVGQWEGPAVCTGLGEAFRQVVGDLGSGEAAFELVGCDEDSHGVFHLLVRRARVAG